MSGFKIAGHVLELKLGNKGMKLTALDLLIALFLLYYICSMIDLKTCAMFSTTESDATDQTQSRLGHLRLRIFALNFHWFVVLFTLVVIGQL